MIEADSKADIVEIGGQDVELGLRAGARWRESAGRKKNLEFMAAAELDYAVTAHGVRNMSEYYTV